MDARTSQARKMMHQAALSLKNIEKSSEVLRLEELQPSLFVLQSAVNLLTNKINLAIISNAESGDEAIKEHNEV